MTDRQTDRETDGQTSCHGIVLATHARHAVKIGDRMVEAPITRRGRRREEGNGKEFLPPRPTPWSGESRELPASSPSEVLGGTPVENGFGSLYSYQKVTDGNDFADIELQLYIT